MAVPRPPGDIGRGGVLFRPRCAEPKDQRGYLLPVNADPNIPEINGYPIDMLYENLAKLEIFRDCDVCPEMVVIPAGRFTMGSPSGEAGRNDDEGPQHAVTIPAPFAVGKFEVTFAEWDACVSAGGCNRHRPIDEGWGRVDRPAMNVSWDDANAYIDWLNGQIVRKVAGAGGLGGDASPYRLLTEAEWEYAARAGTTTARYWGNDIGRGNANCIDCEDQRDRTAAVGSFTANRFGLHGVLGNLWEWVEDCWHDNYRGAPVAGEAWVTDCDDDMRVLRGGSQASSRNVVRSANRYRGTTENRFKSYGFRVARTL